MAVWPFAHWRWVLLALAVSSLAAIPSWADDGPLLQANYPAAVTKARREGKLLLVVDLSGDFTAPSVLSDVGRGYQSLALADERVRDVLLERFVVTFRAVGMPASLNLALERGKPKPAEPERQHAIAYICLPDQRVIHFIPGFVTADQLLAELAWAESCYFDLVRFPPSEQPVAVRQMHLAAADPADVTLLSKATKTTWLLDIPTREVTRDNLTFAVTSARQLRTTRLDERFAGAQNALPARVFYDALADHASLNPTPAHVVLSEFPLPPLADLAQPLYEIWFRDHFWQPSPRRGELKDWFVARVGKGRPVLLAITNQSVPSDEQQPRQRFAWQPAPDADLPLAEFDQLELSLDEITVLTTDIGLAPLSAQRNELPRFVVYDRIGRRRAVLTTSDGISKLRLAMRASAQPGVAAALDKGKKRDK